MAKEILLYRDKVAVVDDDNYSALSKHSRYYNPDKNTGYACRTRYYVDESGKRRWETLGMHRVIMGLQKGDARQVDHVDGNGLNNQKSNLRICTRVQNAQNRHARVGRKSRYKGVTRVPHSGTWGAYIRVNGKQEYLGTFLTEDMAATAYNRAACSYFKEFAQLNDLVEIEPIEAWPNRYAGGKKCRSISEQPYCGS